MKTLSLFAAAATAALSAHAVEPFKTYDNFGSATLDTAKWQETERVRQVRRGALNLVQKTLPASSSDSGSTFANWNENFANPAAVTAIKAKITVNALDVSSCAANTAVGQSRARIVGGFFNTGTPTPGSQLGDMIAQVRLTRFANSTDPAGTLRVQGVLARCTSADCNSSTVIGAILDLGTVTVGTATTVQLQWDAPAKTFLFSRDNGGFSGSVAYTDSDTQPPGVAFKQLSTRVDLPNCSAGGSAALVDATFDNVQVNQSAAP